MFSPAAWLKTPTIPISRSCDPVKKKKEQDSIKTAIEQPFVPDMPNGIARPPPLVYSAPLDSADPATHNIVCRPVTFAFDDDSGMLYSNTWVLSLHSPVFAAMFSGQFAEAEKSVVPLPGKKLTHMQALLNCLHNLHFCRPIGCYLRPDLAVPVLALVKEYQVQVLWEPGLQYLRGLINRSSVVEHFREVLDYKLEELEYSILAEMSLLYANCLRTLEVHPKFRELNRSVQERVLSALCVFHHVTPANEVLGADEWFGHDPNCKGCGRVKDIIVQCDKCQLDNFMCSHCRQYGIFVCYACNQENPLNIKRMRQRLAPIDRETANPTDRDDDSS